jgi:hypothetical protein
MTWDNSPWAVEGAQTSADVGRLMAWHATGGFAGVARPTDLLVKATDVPGGTVRVMPGACSIPVMALGKFLQSYVGVNPTEDTISIPASGSGGTVSHLIVARVENPITGEPWQPPADPVTGQYIFTRRYTTGVTTSTTHVAQVDPSASAITLARVDVPANTGTITQAMITDLRGQRSVPPAAPTTPPEPADPPLPTTPYSAANQDFYDAIDFDRTTVTEDSLRFDQSSYKRWPNVAQWNLCIPRDATEMVAKIDVHCEQRPVSGQSVSLAHCWGYARLRVVGTGVDFSIDVEFDRDYYGGGSPTTVLIPIGGKAPIPAIARGKTLTFQCEARQFTDGNTKGQLVIAKGSFIHAHVHFVIKPTTS